MIKKKEEITVREAGARGGRTTLERKGAEFFCDIGRKGGQRTATLYYELLSTWGKQGGRPRRPSLQKDAGEEFAEKKEDLRSAQTNSPPT
jgi:hypothetical protein